MKTQIYTPFVGITLKEAIESAYKMSLSSGDSIILKINGMQFVVKSDAIAYSLQFVSGFTISQAIEEAVKAAKVSNKPIIANINDVQLRITKNTVAEKALEIYKRILKDKYDKQMAQFKKAQTEKQNEM